MDAVKIEISKKIWVIAINFTLEVPSQFNTSTRTIHLNPDLSSEQMMREIVWCIAEIECLGLEEAENYPKLLEKARKKARMFLSKIQSGNPFVLEKRQHNRLRRERKNFSKLIAEMEATNV